MFDIERELFSLQKAAENEVVASMGRRPELSIKDRNIAFGLLEAGTRVADVARSFEGNESTIYCLQACFLQSGSEKDRPQSGRPRITTPREIRFMVTSSRRYRFTAAPKLVERLIHTTGTLIYVFTARKRLSAAGLKFEF